MCFEEINQCWGGYLFLIQVSRVYIYIYTHLHIYLHNMIIWQGVHRPMRIISIASPRMLPIQSTRALRHSVWLYFKDGGGADSAMLTCFLWWFLLVCHGQDKQKKSPDFSQPMCSLLLFCRSLELFRWCSECLGPKFPCGECTGCKSTWVRSYIRSGHRKESPACLLQVLMFFLKLPLSCATPKA